MRRHAVALLALSSVVACATPESDGLRGDPGGLPLRAEVAGVPFHPQEVRYCGPAALATVLGWSGLDARQDALAAAVYTPGREGTLGTDLIGAARRQGRLALPVTELSGLLTEVAAGHPVLVLQNLGLDWYPQWHYAVAVGYDLEAGTMVLRSGRERRRVISLGTFEHTWRRAGYWGLVVLPPDVLPAGGGEAALLRAAAGLELARRYPEAATAYHATLRRWPDSLGALIGRGNAHYAGGDLAAAEAAYRAAIDHHPDAAVAWNNLADVLAARGERADAVRAAERAISLGGAHAATYRRTLDEIIAGAA